MKRLGLWGILAALACAEPAPEDLAAMEARARRLKALVADLDSPNAALRDDAMSGLLAAGGDAIPYVMDAIYRKDARRHLELLEKLMRSDRDPLPAELRLREEDLEKIVKERLGDPKVAAEGKHWLYLKYKAAVDEYRKGRYDAALEKANAILTLEPRADFAQDVTKLRILCEEQQIQTWLVRTSAAPSKPICGDGEMVRVSFSLTNVAAGPVEVWFGPKAGQNDPLVRQQVLARNAVLEVEVVEATVEADGSFLEIPACSTKPLEKYSIPVKQGETLKIHEMEVFATEGGDEKRPKLKRIRVTATMRVDSVDGPTPVSKQRIIRFPAAEIRVVPGDIQQARQNTLQKMLAAIDAKAEDAVFWYCCLMPEKDRAPASEPFERILRKPDSPEVDRAIARNCLRELTGKPLMTDEEWLKYFDGGGAQAPK